MWLYYCLLSTVIWGFVAIAIKKCSNVILSAEEMYDLPLGTSITYDIETDEILYGIDQDPEDILYINLF